jgi:hypothetical protein
MKVTARSLNRDPRNPRIRRSWGLSLCITGLVFSSAFLLYGTENPTPAIKLDQVGYLDGAPKVALVASPAKTFEIRRSSDGRVVFRGALSPAATDPLSGDTVQAADFSGLRQAGTYYVEVPGVGKSWTFAVGANVFEHTYYMTMRGFYGQRCGTAVDMGPEFPGYSRTPHVICMASSIPSSGANPDRATTLADGTTRAIMAVTLLTLASPPARCCGPGKSTVKNSREFGSIFPSPATVLPTF